MTPFKTDSTLSSELSRRRAPGLSNPECSQQRLNVSGERSDALDGDVKLGSGCLSSSLLS